MPCYYVAFQLWGVYIHDIFSRVLTDVQLVLNREYPEITRTDPEITRHNSQGSVKIEAVFGWLQNRLPSFPGFCVFRKELVTIRMYRKPIV